MLLDFHAAVSAAETREAAWRRNATSNWKHNIFVEL
jgi:hypothetical protein